MEHKKQQDRTPKNTVRQQRFVVGQLTTVPYQAYFPEIPPVLKPLFEFDNPGRLEEITATVAELDRRVWWFKCAGWLGMFLIGSAVVISMLTAMPNFPFRWAGIEWITPLCLVFGPILFAVSNIIKDRATEKIRRQIAPLVGTVRDFLRDIEVALLRLGLIDKDLGAVTDLARTVQYELERRALQILDAEIRFRRDRANHGVPDTELIKSGIPLIDSRVVLEKSVNELVRRGLKLDVGAAFRDATRRILDAQGISVPEH